MTNQISRLAAWSVCFIAATVSLGAFSIQAEEPFDYYSNSWNVIGLKDYNNGSQITPSNELLLSGGDKLQLRFGNSLTPLDSKQIKTLREGWLPIILLSEQDGAVRYDFTVWATPLPTVKDWRRAFDWPTEGENFLNWITVKVTNTGSDRAEAKFASEILGESRKEKHENSWSLASGESVEDCVRVPFAAGPDSIAIDKEDPKVWLDRTEEYWRGVLASATQIEVPCRKSVETLKTAHVLQLITNDHGMMHPGEGPYDEFYVRDAAYQILELEEAGMNDAAQKAIEWFFKFQKSDGRFESQDNELDGNGQALWAFWQYGRITNDRAWLEKVYPRMMEACRWTMKTRREAPADSPLAGLLPPAFADGENLFDRKHHIVGYDFWNLRGLLCTADVARLLGKDADAKELLAEADDYRKAIDAACKRSGVDYFPASWEKEGAFWGNTETLWPTKLFAEDDPRVVATIRQARGSLGGGFTEGTIHWTGKDNSMIHPYMSSYTTMASLARGDAEQVVEDFYWYLLHSSAAHAFGEGIYFERRYATNETMPHATGASNYAFLLRHMLVHENEDELHLLAAVPDWWLGDGQKIVVQNAPTHFGPMSLSVRGTSSGVEVQLTKPTRNPPNRIVLHLPESRPLIGELSGIDVVVRPDQKKRWDFPTVVELYSTRKTAPSK
jgi:hypothetical protein